MRWPIVGNHLSHRILETEGRAPPLSPPLAGGRSASSRRVWRWGGDRWALVVLLLLAWTLRLSPALENRLHADEALYGYWGLLIARGEDPWLAAALVDKPPLVPYLVASSQALLGRSRGGAELAVRWPGLTLGLLTVPLVAALAYSLYCDRWVALTAAVATAFSPFAILFSATAFTDTPMLGLGLAACLAAARRWPGWAGLLAGLSFAAKPTGLVFLPLALGASLIRTSNARGSMCHGSMCHLPPHRGGLGRACVSLVVCFSLVVALVFAWNAVRIGWGGESFWRIGVTRYGGVRLIWPQELWPRLCEWVGVMRYLFVSPVVNGVLMLGLPVLVWRALPAACSTRYRWVPASAADVLFFSFCLIYVLVHWLWAFPIWDRYLLPLAPLLAISLGRIFSLLVPFLHLIAARFRCCTQLIWRLPPCLTRQFTPSGREVTAISWPNARLAPLIVAGSFIARLTLLASLILLLLTPAWHAGRSRYPVGGDHGAYDGIDAVASFLRELPEGAVVYHHWLGWHYSYYLFDAPVYLAYWPTPAWLARDVQVFGATDPRYVTFPSWESSVRVEWALAGVGYGLTPVSTTIRRDGTISFIIYRILPLRDR